MTERSMKFCSSRMLQAVSSSQHPDAKATGRHALAINQQRTSPKSAGEDGTLLALSSGATSGEA
jgi:hypothetical protein